jgi:hypothetical protein
MIHKLIAANDPVKDVFGDVSPPPGMFNPGDNPVMGVSSLLGKGIQLFVLLAGLFMLFFLLWGALDWIMSGGDKEKLSKAQSKLTNAVIGFIILFVALSAFGLITGDILGIMQRGADGSWNFVLPSLGNPPTP